MYVYVRGVMLKLIFEILKEVFFVSNVGTLVFMRDYKTSVFLMDISSLFFFAAKNESTGVCGMKTLK